MKKLYALILFGFGLMSGCGSSSTPPIAAIVDGDSMAPTVCGDHLLTSCVECQCDFKAERTLDDGFKLTCPNCGFGELSSADSKLISAAKIELLPFARFPRRWDVVGFELPDEVTEPTGIKRIVGLPGETITIRDGDLYSNDKILRKSWELQKELRIPVFDSKCNAISPFDNSHRFRTSDESSGWEVRGSELRFSSSDDKTDWLEYVHWRNFRSNNERNEEHPIEDSYGFNQQTVRELNGTRDLMFELDAEFENDSTLFLEFQRGKSQFNFEIKKSETEFSFSWNGVSDRKPLVYKSTLEEKLPRGLIEFSSFDHSVMLRINGTAVFELRENETGVSNAGDAVKANEIFRIGGGRGTFKIQRFQLWRDVYYLTAPAGFEAPSNLKLTAGSDEYILLGDNSPKSLDSRSWKKPGISRSDLIGRLVLPLEDK